MKKKKVYKKIVAVTVGAAIMVDAPVMNVFASEENTEVKNSEVASLKGDIKQQDNSDTANASTSDSSKEGVTTKDVKANRTIYLGGVGTSGDPTGDGMAPETAYKYINQAVDAAQDGDIIQLVGDTIIKAAQDTDGGSLPYRITKKVTFIGNSGNENMTWLRPIELGSDVTFQNLRITLPHAGGENNIFAAGYHLTLDNVATYQNGTIRPPYVYGGGYKDHALGNHAQITIRNANDDTKFSGVYAGTKFKDFVGDVTINIDAETTIGDQNNQIGVYASGLRGRLPHGTIDYDYRVKGTVNINVTSNGTGSRIQLFDGFGATDANGNPSANLSLTGVNNQSFKASNFNNVTLNNSTVVVEDSADFIGVSGNLEVVNNSKLNLSKSKITVVGGDFIGETDVNNAGIVQLSEDGLLDVAGTVIGNTSFMTPSIGGNIQGNPPMSGIVRENHTYIKSSANAVGEFLFKPYDTIYQIHMSLEKEQDGGKTKWVTRKEQHTLKDVSFEGKNRVTVDEVNEGNDEDDKGFILKVKSYDTNDALFATAFEYKILDDQGQEVTDIEGYYHGFDGDKLVQYVKIAPTFMTASIGQYKLVLISEENGNTYEFDFEITATLTDTVTIEGDPKLGNSLTAKVDGLPQGVNEQDLNGNTYEFDFEITATLTDTVTIEGDPKLGNSLTAKVDGLPQGVNEQDLIYQWYVNGVAVQGATGKTWAVNGNVNDEVYVEVSHANYANKLVSQAVTLLDKDQIVGNVTIEGDSLIGSTLTAKVEALPQGVNEQDLTYQWYVNGVAVQGATGKTWVVNGNIDDEVYVEVSHPNYPQGVNEQDLTYQWYVNGVAVQGATGKTWVVNGNIDDEVYVEVSHPNYLGVLKSQSVTIGKSQLTGQVTLPATVQVSDTLSVNFSGLPNNTGVLSYKWYVDGKFVSNQSFYTVPKEDLGKKITVELSAENYQGVIISNESTVIERDLTGTVAITGTAEPGQTLTADTKITVELSAENYQGVIISNESTVIERDLTGTVAITGTAEPGQTLTADTTGLPANAYDFTYQWYVDGKPVAGATQSTWVSDANNVGLPITVEVTAINYTSSVTSNPVILQKISIVGKGQVSITGTAEPGQTLTADTLGLPNDAGDLSYQWYVDGNPVPGATEKTWVSDITGTAEPGQTLTADTLGLPNDAGDLSYQWYVDGNPVPGATEKTWVSDASNVGLPITVEVTATNYNDRLQSAEVVLVKTALSGTVAINGTPKVGETLTAVLQNLPQDAGDLTYQWFANGNPIPNATNADWIAEDGYADATITVQVSAKNYNNHVISNGVVLAKKDLTGTVTIDGMPKVGETLTANLQNVPNDAQNVTIKWFAGDKEIATGPTWVSTYDYVGQEITVRVTADNYAGELVSDKLTLAKKDLVGTITISGKPQFSETLMAVTAQLPADVQNVKYEWYVDGELVKGVASDTWKPGKDIVGKTVTVKVTADNYAGALTSTGVVLQAKDITGDVVISGVNKPGNELKADVINLPADAQNVSYQWYTDGVAIPNATSSSWIVDISGVNKPGNELKADVINLPADAQNVSYQWYTDGVAIPNATSSSWIVDGMYEGQTITVQVVADNYTGSATGAGVVVQPADKVPSVSIDGKPVVGSTLTAILQDLPVGAQNITYQWYANGVAIPNATSSSWIVEEAYAGQIITVKVKIDNFTSEIESLGIGVTHLDGVAIPNATSSSWIVEEAYAGQIITVKVKIDNFTSEIESLGIGVTHLEENSTNTDKNTPNTGDSTNVFMLLLMAFGAILTKVGILFKASKEKE